MFDLSRYRTLTTIGLLILLATTACDTHDASSTASPSTNSPAVSPTSTTPHTFADLGTHPCSALDVADTTRFGVTAPGTEQPGAARGCFWTTPTTGFSFYPHPSSDLTTPLPPVPGATAITVADHRAVQIRQSLPQGKEAGCTITVATTTGGSFNVEVAIAGAGSDTAPVVDTCALGIDIATAVLSHLA
ncbi:DUF3558 family protein [Nocardia sp. NPDC050630]|uniref:DUF3558 family protein n=1 Tax=Nocardia sp. NPDC050630 TaxID=3364321 RepID=UPI0037B31712